MEQMEDYRSKGYIHLSPTTYCVNAVLNASAKIAMNSKVNGAAFCAKKILTRMEDLYNNGDDDSHDERGHGDNSEYESREELRPNTIRKISLWIPGTYERT